jgi:DNA transformation protein
MPMTPQDAALFARFTAAAVSLGPVRARPMFGGYGLYLDGVMVGLLTGGEHLYLKAGPGNQAAFDAAGLPPFVYLRQGQPVALSYRAAPADGDWHPWIAGALAAAKASAGRRKPAASRRSAPPV